MLKEKSNLSRFCTYHSLSLPIHLILKLCVAKISALIIIIAFCVMYGLSRSSELDGNISPITPIVVETLCLQYRVLRVLESDKDIMLDVLG